MPRKRKSASSPTQTNLLDVAAKLDPAYDSAGNMETDGSYSYAYNAESEIKSAAGVNYTYDGDGNRLEKSNGKLYWYGAGTEILDESDLSGNFTNEYVSFAGKRIAMRNVSTGTISYYEEDMLGSSRTIVQAGQTSPCYDADFLPFGYEKDVTSTCTTAYKFEGKERDTETNNDYFGARYYSNHFGRWLSPDWAAAPTPIPYANMTNPQTLNLYAMVSDNPESFADLDGHDEIKNTGVCEGDKVCSPDSDLACLDAPGACSVIDAGEFLRNVTDEDSNGQTEPAAEQKAEDDAATQKNTAQQNQDPTFKESWNGLLDALFNRTASTPGEEFAKGNASSALGLLTSGGVGEASDAEQAIKLTVGAASKSEKIAALTKEAEEAYPKLAAKATDELHHVVPKYLGGAKNGETVALRPAYHQLITNEFRRLAPYGQQIERSAAEVGRIVEQVYSKYPLPY